MLWYISIWYNISMYVMIYWYMLVYHNIGTYQYVIIYICMLRYVDTSKYIIMYVIYANGIYSYNMLSDLNVDKFMIYTICY